MGLRINNNIQAVNGHRNLQKNDAMAGRSMEKLSSGLRINKAADDAAGLIISEQMRAQIAGLGQAISNSETAVNLVQTAEGALDEMNTLLKKARTLALHAANEGANDSSQLVADQSELDNITNSIDRIAQQTQFGNKKILDGSLTSFRSNSDLVGSTKTGNHYAEGLKTGTITRGYHSLVIHTNAAQGNTLLTMAGASDIIATGSYTTVHTGSMMGNATNTLLNMQGGDQFLKAFELAVNGRSIKVVSGSTKDDLVNTLNTIGRDLGFKAVLVENATAVGTSGLLYNTPITTGSQGLVTSSLGYGNIALINDSYGSAAEVSVDYVAGASGATNLTSAKTTGRDMEGWLVLNSGAVGAVAQPLITSGAAADSVSNTGSWVDIAQSGSSLTLVSTTAGQGYRITLNSLLFTASTVTGATGGSGGGGILLGTGFSAVEGLGTTMSGTFYGGLIDGMSAGSTFQVGANVGQTVTVEMASMKSTDLGSGASQNLRSLGGLAGALSGGNAQEALKVIDKAIEEVTGQRGKLGAFQANTLESGLNSLRVSKENLTGAESNIRDVDFADESAQFTKYQILVQASTAMLAQANQLPQNVLKLLG